MAPAYQGAMILLILVISATRFIDIPKTWDLNEINHIHLHPPDRSVKVEFVPEEIYYNLNEYVLYKNYPYYIRELAPDGYYDSLRKLEPEIAVDFTKLETEEDWIEAGRLVFEMPVAIRPVSDQIFHDTTFVNQVGLESTTEGIIPYLKLVRTPEGLMSGSLSCATCHTKVMENGDVIAGGQGDFPFDRQFGFIIEMFDIRIPGDPNGPIVYAPWANADFGSWTREDRVAALKAIPDGVMVRQGSGAVSPLAIPSLFGIKDIKYFDRTGLMKHEKIEDLMLYAAFNQGMDMFTKYDDYIPMPGFDSHDQITPDKDWTHPFGYNNGRYSDEQLYALAKYIYSLEAPKNPDTAPAEVLDRGKIIFAEQGCVTCHPPPLFTNNMLLPASDDFQIPEEDKENLDIFNLSVGTDPTLALKTRRGTGYYKVPSLRGTWMREAFFHNGNLASVEDVLDPSRLNDDYVPTGFKPPHLETMAVPGHPFGMELNKEDKTALIAYLNSL